MVDYWNVGCLDGWIGVCVCGLRWMGGEVRGEIVMMDGRVGG